MIYADIPAGQAVFLDANTLIQHFTADPITGMACTELLERIENQVIHGYTSTHDLGEMIHRLMTAEACARFGWPSRNIAPRLRSHPQDVQQLRLYQQAVDEVPLLQVQVLPVTAQAVSLAVDVCRQHGLLCNDALIVVMMRLQGLTLLASQDADFDRIPGLTRYAPV